MYYQETVGADICGLQVKLSFVNPTEAKGLTSPVLEKARGVVPDRRCCVLLIGLPPHFSQWQILKTMWDYDFIDNDDLAAELLPVGKIKYGGSPYLLRLRSEDEARRVVRDLNGQIFPNTSQRVFLELVD